MFDRFIRLARAKKALQEQRFEDALQLSADPLIQSERRAEVVRQAAVTALLDRARRHLASGDLALANGDVDRLREFASPDALQALREEIAVATAERQAGVDRDAAVLGVVRAAIQEGRLAHATEQLEQLVGRVPAERRAFESMIAERRRQALEVAKQAEAMFTADAAEAAVDLLARAEMLDRDGVEVVALRAKVLAGAGDRLAAILATQLDRGDLDAALASYRRAIHALPAISAQPPFAKMSVRLADCIAKAFLACGSVEEACGLARSVRSAEAPSLAATPPLVDALLAVQGQSEQPGGQGADIVSAAALAAAARGAGATVLAEAAERWLRAAGDRDAQLALVRQAIDAGEFDRAQVLLDILAAKEPLHEGVRREQAVVAQGVAGLEARLLEARSSLQTGRLQQACVRASAITGVARITAEAQRLQADARARMALVDRGLGEVRVALHGRAAATVDGVRHCLRRLEELAKVQGDHEELPGVIEAVQAEIAALLAWDAASATIDRGQLPEAARAVAELLPFRARLLVRERLDARLCDLADRLARLVDVALAAGRLGEVAIGAEIFDQLAAVRADFQARADEWRRVTAERHQSARTLLAAARDCLAGRDLAAAEQALERAQAVWRDSSEARELAAELLTTRQHSDVLERVAELARDRDFQGARQKLAEMAATPLLRSRIYDMKQNLARAQGLEGSFLLRVDEGGEQLVMRGETVSLGNVRQSRADLPVLANLAGRHASVRRSMSFHGGMQDLVVAEEGEVSVGGKKLASHSLGSGDKVQLGATFGFTYRRPTTRSLTVSLTLQSGFQVGGTDRVLLMKDRGRDGRILIGNGNDVHVRVARATGEVEVFANSGGQIRVAAAEGTIDGVPFRGEHPVAAGQIVAAAGISFVLLPWRPGA